MIGDRWVVSHMPLPLCLGGEEVGVAHKRCNQLRWANTEAPQVAKEKRVRAKHIGAHRSARPFRGWRLFDGRYVYNEGGNDERQATYPQAALDPD
jgi:hypothetical protein